MAAMQEFDYRAKNKKGKITAGSLDAKNINEAKKRLKQMGLKPISVKVHKDTILSSLLYYDEHGNLQIQIGSGLPGLKELAVFTKQFNLMVERGVPLIQALSILASQQKSFQFKRILNKIRDRVENGASLSDALAEHPKVFSNLYVSMIRSGEMSGNLDVALSEINKFLEKAAKLRAQIKSATIYPSIILAVAISVIYGILAFLVPVFADQYKGMGKELPALTQIVVNISEFLSANVIYLVGGVVAFIVAIIQIKKTPKGKEFIDQLLLKLPLTGEVVRKIAISRFTSTMATMMAAGVGILDALEICGASSGNKVIEEFIKYVSSQISQGANFSEPLSEGGLFPPMVVSMVAVGEQTGALDETLEKIAEIYEEEVDVAVKNMTDMFQPLLIVLIGGVLGFVIIALYLPIFDQASMAG